MLSGDRSLAMAPDAELLFGMLALQVGLIDQGQLVAAFQAWTRDKARPLAEHLTARGDLDAEQRVGVEAMVALHLRKHGTAERSLAAIPAGRSTREGLGRIGDPDLGGTLARLSAPATEHDRDEDRTDSYAVGTATSDGQRFRVLRPHARGGLGAVFVALDAELHREVALKQILDLHADDPDSRQRFLSEAEITGGLEHPGIVPVYGLGTYGDGRPYYAMRFVRGDSLKEAIERFHADEGMKSDPGRRSLELRKLLRRFVDVCNAIGYAHSRGVLHRDIKPGNIVVGKHGETLVVDWGLAKPLGHAEPGHDQAEHTLIPHSASGSAETLPGSALGTPAYMSPEEAQGELDRLGPRSDVYSLGATLYCLLTGAPPFVGDAVDVIPRVRRGEFRPPRVIDLAIDRALEAVCLKAMALRPEDRYASPKALAEDVERWMADEPVAAFPEPWVVRTRRWLSRHRTLTTAVAAAVAVLVLSLGAATVLLTAANERERQARGRAEANLGLARKAVDRGLTRVSETPELKAGALEGLRRDLLREAKDFYEQFAQQEVDEPGLQAERGEAYLRLAHITEDLGERPEAIALARRAQEVFDVLVRRHAGVAEYQDDLGRALTTLGRNSRESGQFESALEALQRSVENYLKIVAAHPGVPAYRFNLARTFNQLGLLYLRGLKKLPEGVAAVERAEELCGRLVKEFPEEPEYRSELAQTYTNLIYQADYSGKYDQAVADGERAVPVLEQLVRDYPLVADYQFRLAFVLSNLAASHSNNRQPERLLEAGSKALPVAERLLRAHPDVPAYRNRLAFIRFLHGEALAQRGEFRRAIAELEAAERDASEGITLFAGACGYCLSAMAAEKDASLSPGERKSLAGQYLDRAMALLRKSRDTTPLFKSAQGVELLRKDADLEPLRPRDDFQRFLTQVEGEARQRK
jgi:serine/threonine-protein kinase